MYFSRLLDKIRKSNNIDKISLQEYKIYYSINKKSIIQKYIVKLNLINRLLLG
jgi:hypothetical protein